RAAARGHLSRGRGHRAARRAEAVDGAEELLGAGEKARRAAALGLAQRLRAGGRGEKDRDGEDERRRGAHAPPYSPSRTSGCTRERDSLALRSHSSWLARPPWREICNAWARNA